VIGANAQHISLSGASQHSFEGADTVDAVGRHPGERHLCRQRLLDHPRRQGRLGGEAGVLRTCAAVMRAGSSVHAFGR
jgi:hypothetical protein